MIPDTHEPYLSALSNKIRALYKNHFTLPLPLPEMQDLQDIVNEKRRRFAGHILRLPNERPAKVAMTWTPKMGKRKMEGQKRPGDRLFERTSTRWA